MAITDGIFAISTVVTITKQRFLDTEFYKLAAHMGQSTCEKHRGIKFYCFGSKTAGLAPGKLRPKSSLIWLTKIMMAIPTVKPMVTGCGTYLMWQPRRKAPKAKIKIPAMSVAGSKPSTPWRWPSIRPMQQLLASVQPQHRPEKPQHYSLRAKCL